MSKNIFSTLFTRMAPAAILMLTPVLASASFISLAPSSTSVTVGETFQLDIIATALQIGAFDVTFRYNPLSASIDQNLVTFDTHLGGPTDSFPSVFAGLDNLELAEVSFLTSAADLAALQTSPSFPLAHIQVKALQPGTLSFDFIPTEFTLISDFGGSPIAGVLYQGTTVSVMAPTEPPPPSAVDAPEPSGVPLLMSVLCFLAAALLRRNRKMANAGAQVDQRKNGHL